MAASLSHPTDSPPTADDFAAAVEAAKLQALYNFAYGLSHEINNPLANIATRAQTLLLDETDPQRRRKLTTINQQAFRAHQMIADLMYFARPPSPRRQEVDLAELARTAVAEMQDQARQQETRLSYTGASGPLIATVDPGQITMALKAIITNALEALRKEGSVEVNAECRMQNAECGESEVQGPTSKVDPAHAVPIAPNLQSAIRNPQSPAANPQSAIRNLQLIVADTGPGIPPEIRPHIFDPYFSGREAGRGLGLGLSKAWRIVELHGGTIEVECPAEGGARFTLALP
jgi:signal transduction histidine kinase